MVGLNGTTELAQAIKSSNKAERGAGSENQGTDWRILGFGNWNGNGMNSVGCTEQWSEGRFGSALVWFFILLLWLNILLGAIGSQES